MKTIDPVKTKIVLYNTGLVFFCKGSIHALDLKRDYKNWFKTPLENDKIVWMFPFNHHGKITE